MRNRLDDARRRELFVQAEQAKREERRRRYRETTPGERLESALRLSQLTSELRSGLRPRGD